MARLVVVAMGAVVLCSACAATGPREPRLKEPPWRLSDEALFRRSSAPNFAQAASEVGLEKGVQLLERFQKEADQNGNGNESDDKKPYKEFLGQLLVVGVTSIPYVSLLGEILPDPAKKFLENAEVKPEPDINSFMLNFEYHVPP